MQGINQKYNRAGKTVGVAVMALVLLLSFMVRIDPPMLVPDEKEDEQVVMIMDFTNSGGGSAGGSNVKAEEPKEDAAPDKQTNAKDPKPDETVQKDPSPTHTKPSETSSTANGTGTSQNPAISGNPFGGSGGGDGGGDGSGSDGSGLGPGDGPGIGPGKGDGSGRIVMKEPKVENPVQSEGRVMLELTINRDGKVIEVKVLKTHSLTTTTNPSHFKVAEKAAWDWEFNSDSKGAEKQTVFKSINFTLD